MPNRLEEEIIVTHKLTDVEIMQRFAQMMTSTIGRGWRPDATHAKEMLRYLRVLVDHAIDDELKDRRI